MAHTHSTSPSPGRPDGQGSSPGDGRTVPPMPELFYTPEEIAALLDGSWRIEVSEARPRPATTPDGAEVTVHDTVLVAVRPGP